MSGAREPGCSTSALSDALDAPDLRGAVVEGLQPVVPAAGCVVGRARTATVVSTGEPGIPGIADLLDGIVPGDVLVLAWRADAVRASTFGGLAAAHTVHRGGLGLVSEGWVRDVDELRASGLPVWARGVTPRSGKGRLAITAIGEPAEVGGVTVVAGDTVVLDATGICVVAAADAAEALRRARHLDGLDRDFRAAVAGGASFGRAAATTGAV